MAVYQWGSRGPVVVEIQKALNAGIVANHPALEPDGAFGRKTRDAVIVFQRENALEPDGIVGNNTIGRLVEHNDALKRQAPNSGGPPPLVVLPEQLQKGGLDCGFLASYVVAQYGKSGGNLNGLSASIGQILAARDSFKVSGKPYVDPKYRGREQDLDGVYLRPNDAPTFMRHVGASGFYFEYYTFQHAQQTSEADFTQQLRDATVNGTRGIAISAPTYYGFGKSGHWLAALKVEHFNGKDHVLIYDCGRGVPQGAASHGYPANKMVCWVPTRNLRILLTNAMYGTEAGVMRV